MKVPEDLGRTLTSLGVIKTGRQQRVYFAWDHSRWCPVACKVFRSRDRCRHEARVLERLRHPNIVRLLAWPSATRLVLEYLEGPTLARMLRQLPKRRLGVSDAARIGIHIGAALAHMHRRGFLHLDVKPGNVVIVRDRPVLVDFEISRAPISRRSDRIEGSEAYMAPEQCDGGPLTTAVDVFGLGVTLFEALTGRLPFPPPDRRHHYPQQHMDPPPLRAAAPHIPRSLDELVGTCLARRPDARPTLDLLLPSLHGHVRSGPRMWPAAVDRATRIKERVA